MIVKEQTLEEQGQERDEEDEEEGDHIPSEDDGESEIEETSGPSTRSGTRRKHSRPK